MKVMCREARPVRQPDGSMKVIVSEVERDIPDKGRTPLFCNHCPLDNYPQCKPGCRMINNPLSGLTDEERFADIGPYQYKG